MYSALQNGKVLVLATIWYVIHKCAFCISQVPRINWRAGRSVHGGSIPGKKDERRGGTRVEDHRTGGSSGRVGKLSESSCLFCSHWVEVRNWGYVWCPSEEVKQKMSALIMLVVIIFLSCFLPAGGKCKWYACIDYIWLGRSVGIFISLW